MPDEDEYAEFNAKTEASRQQLVLARAEAIDAYASLEHWLCSLFAGLTKMDHDAAAIVFYRIANTRSRNAIIEDLLRRRFGTTYRAYWNSMLKFLGQLDQKRNQIVHWHIGGSPEAEYIAAALQRPGNSYFLDPDGSKLTQTDLTDFMGRAQFAATSICCFCLLEWGGFSDPDEPRAWHDTFLQPLIYPPPEAHPLSRMLQGRRSPPESSQA